MESEVRFLLLITSYLRGAAITAGFIAVQHTLVILSVLEIYSPDQRYSLGGWYSAQCIEEEQIVNSTLVFQVFNSRGVHILPDLGNLVTSDRVCFQVWALAIILEIREGR
jgi:hypothetical protein